MSPSFAFFLGNSGPTELIIIGMIALLLFGKRLPEVMRSLGKGITEFKKGVSGIEDEVNRPNNYQSYGEPSRPVPTDERLEVTAPKFTPPTTAPTEPQATKPV